MTRHLFLFCAAFVAGALIALVVRAAGHRPESGQLGAVAPGGDYAPQVANVSAAPALPPPPVAASANPAPVPPGRPVNTVCAICGMDVDPKLPTAEYQGKTIGFGCRMCPPKFKAAPDRYGPHYLRNEVVPR
jgi:YHS domain-containing protein